MDDLTYDIYGIMMNCVDLIMIAIVATHYNPHGNMSNIKIIAENVCYYSYERNLDPYMVVAIIRHESFFRRKARSHTGDLGLMQLNTKYFRGCNLLKVKCNIDSGTKFLVRLRKRYGNSRSHWLRWYNWNSYRHHIRILWLTKAYRMALNNSSLYGIIKSGKYRRLSRKGNYKDKINGIQGRFASPNNQN